MMKVVKKVASVLVMIFSALLVLVMLAGIVGSWWGAGQLKVIVSDVTTTLDRTLERSQAAVGQINTIVVASQGRVDEASAKITMAGSKVEETNLALVAAEKLLDQDLTPAIDRMNERVSDTRDTLAIAEQTIALMQMLPGSRDNKLLNLADEVIQKVRNLGQTLRDARISVSDAKSRVTGEAVSKLTAPLDKVSAALGEVNADLVGLDQRIDQRQEQLQVLSGQVLTAITLAAVALTLAFLWMALAQLGLFVHAYGIFTGRDPLARWHKGRAKEEPLEALTEPTGGAA